MKVKLPKFKLFKKYQKYFLPSILFVILLALTTYAYQTFIFDKYHPRTFVGDAQISFLTEGQAIKKVQTKFNERSNQKLNFAFAQGVFELDLATSSASLDYSSFATVLEQNHKGNFWERLKKQVQTFLFTYQLNPHVKLNLDRQIETIERSVNKPPIDAQLVFDEITTEEGTPSARIQIKEGVDGLTLDTQEVASQAAQFLLKGSYQSQLPIRATSPNVTTEKLLVAKKTLENIAKQPLELKFENFNWTLDTKQLLTLLNLTGGTNDLLDKDKTDLYLEKIAQELDQEVQEGLFEFDPTTKRVSSFKPSQDGRKLNIDNTYQLLSDALLEEGVKVVNLPVEVVKPKISTQDVNSLGIQELLGRGISHFAGSIPNRIYNVGLTAAKLNGVLIPPDTTFSFNQTVGDISAATGFKQAYVIKEGRTVLDDGGGVCQDSTTLFRAVLNSGLPVIKRTAHAYRVGYYEQGFAPGLDATIYYPSVDFQFKNDTKAHILIQAYTSGTTLYIDLYGTPDGRQVSLTQPVVTNQTPPPPELRQDDPTLPKGQVKQVDWSAWGATVTFSRTVTRGGETLIKETFKSNYKAWQAVYLVGTKEN